jgi:hypothetical protein
MLHSENRDEQKKLILSTVPLFKSANDERRHTSHIRSTEVTVTDGAVFTLAYETRSYCSFIGNNRFPVHEISLSLSTIADRFILDRATRKEWIRAGFKFKGIPGGGKRDAGPVRMCQYVPLRSRRPAPPCAELCEVSM